MNRLPANRIGWTAFASGFCLLTLTAAGCGSSGPAAADVADTAPETTATGDDAIPTDAADGGAADDADAADNTDGADDTDAAPAETNPDVDDDADAPDAALPEQGPELGLEHESPTE